MRKLLFIILLTLPAACTRSVDQAAEIAQAVSATLSAIPPGPTQPLASPIPSATPIDLAGLFCEYQFCIGHPPEMAFYDVSAANNQAAPSNYQAGILAAYNSNLFLQVIWQIAPGSTDAQFLMDQILEEIDTRGNLDVRLVGELNVLFTPITNTTPVVPFGAAAAWLCADRAFAWKAYTADPALAEILFTDALERFECTP